MAEPRVLVVAGDPLARSGLASLLSQADCTVVGQVAGDSDLRAHLTLYQPDVTLWDLGWDPSIELETNLELLADLADSGLPVVALLPAATHVGEVWAAGASGVLRRGAGPKSLVAALQAAVQGLLIVDPELAADVMPSRDPTHEALIEELTPREIEVLQLLADGLTNKAIGQRLAISDHTVKFHVNAILGKLGAQSRTEAVVRATRLGLLLL